MKDILHYLSVSASAILTWCLFYGAQMYFFNEVATKPNWLPAQIVAAIIAALIVWQYCTFGSPYRP